MTDSESAGRPVCLVSPWGQTPRIVARGFAVGPCVIPDARALRVLVRVTALGVRAAAELIAGLPVRSPVAGRV